jgi:hypothetical protein
MFAWGEDTQGATRTGYSPFASGPRRIQARGFAGTCCPLARSIGARWWRGLGGEHLPLSAFHGRTVAHGVQGAGVCPLCAVQRRTLAHGVQGASECPPGAVHRRTVGQGESGAADASRAFLIGAGAGLWHHE